MKVWGMLVICLQTKAVTILALAGYDTISFLTGYIEFTSIYGEPALLVSDHGSQLTAAAKQMGQRSIQWKKIEEIAARSGTKWIFTPKECPWRNGVVERAVGMAKSTLSYQLESNKSISIMK